MQNIFIDFEFDRKKNIISSIGAVYGNNEFLEPVKDLRNSLKKLYNFLPRDNVNFIFFGKEDINMLRKQTRKYQFSGEITGMINGIFSGIDLRDYLYPIKNSQDSILNSLNSDIFLPLHNPLNDSKNLRLLFLKTKEKKIVSRLMKIAENNNVNKEKDDLNIIIHKNIETLWEITKKGSYKKGQNTITAQRILVDKASGKEYIVNDIDFDSINGMFYSIEVPMLIKLFKGSKRNCCIYILENIDAKEMSLEINVSDLQESLGEDQKFCRDFINELCYKGFLKKYENRYYLTEKINLKDESSCRRLLFTNNSQFIKVIA